MKFWDTSAIVPLFVAEVTTEDMQREFERDPNLVVWWGTELECVSALARRERDISGLGPMITVAFARLAALSAEWSEVQPAERVRQMARRLLRVHSLRAADALQLAAAIVAAEDQPARLPFVTLDDRLALAAEREGFAIVRSG